MIENHQPATVILPAILRECGYRKFKLLRIGITRPVFNVFDVPGIPGYNAFHLGTQFMPRLKATQHAQDRIHTFMDRCIRHIAIPGSSLFEREDDQF